MLSVFRRSRAGALLLLALFAAVTLPLGRADAHGFSSTVFADVTSPDAGVVRVDLQLEYDLLVVSVADTQDDDAFFESGDSAWQDGACPVSCRPCATMPTAC